MCVCVNWLCSFIPRFFLCFVSFLYRFMCFADAVFLPVSSSFLSLVTWWYTFRALSFSTLLYNVNLKCFYYTESAWMDFVSVFVLISLLFRRDEKKTTNERKAMTETVLAIGSVQIIINKMLNKKATNHKFCFCILLCRQTTHTHTTIMMVSEFNTFCVCVYVFLLPFFVLWAWLNLDGFNNEKQRHAKRKWITNKSDTNKHSINTHIHTPTLIWKDPRLHHACCTNKRDW